MSQSIIRTRTRRCRASLVRLVDPNPPLPPQTRPKPIRPPIRSIDALEDCGGIGTTLPPPRPTFIDSKPIYNHSHNQLLEVVEPYRPLFNLQLESQRRARPDGSISDAVLETFRRLERPPHRIVLTQAQQSALVSTLPTRLAAELEGISFDRMGRIDPLIRHLPDAWVNWVNQFYQRTADEAGPQRIATLTETGRRHDTRFYASHAADHHWNIAEGMGFILTDAIEAGLLTARDPTRRSCVEQMATLMVSLHDIWMMDCRIEGREKHRDRSAREAFSPELDASIVLMAQGPLGTMLTTLYGVRADQRGDRIREIASMCCGHDARLPLDNPTHLRQALRAVIGGAHHPDFFSWLTDPRTAALAEDSIDAVRCVRAGDALERWRGSDLRTSNGSEIGTFDESGNLNAWVRLTDVTSGKVYPVLIEPDAFPVGEFNIEDVSIQTADDSDRGLCRGDLVCRIREGEKSDCSSLAADKTAHVLSEIWQDYSLSFPVQGTRKLIVETTLGLRGFGEQVVAQLRLRLVYDAHPPEEVRRIDQLPESALSIEAHRVGTEIEDLRFLNSDEGRVTTEMESVYGNLSTESLAGARLIKLAKDELLMVQGGNPQSAYVYIPLEDDSLSISLTRGYAPPPVRRGVPLGDFEAITGTSRNKDVLALRDTLVVALPGAVYRKHWSVFFTCKSLIEHLRMSGSEPSSCN